MFYFTDLPDIADTLAKGLKGKLHRLLLLYNYVVELLFSGGGVFFVLRQCVSIEVITNGACTSKVLEV